MAKKTKMKTSPAKRSSGAPTKARAGFDPIDPRKKLLCRVAGNVAGALVASPSPSIASADKIAAVAVDIAEQILRKVGVAAPNTTAEPSAMPTAVPDEAAS